MERLASLSLLFTLAACDSDPEGAESPCMEEQRAGALAVGDSFEAGGFEVRVESMSPASAVVGENTWELAVAGASGCTVDVVHTMPDHGHGGPMGGVESMGEELWEVQNMEFTMGGYWEIDVEITCDDAVAEVPMALCVDA